MEAPIRQLRKSDILWLSENRCKKHHHSFLTHYQCYLEEKPKSSPMFERVGYFDIETTGLKADFHYVLSYAIRAADNKLYGRVLTTAEIRDGLFDKQLLRELCIDLKRFHRIIVQYGADYKFDIPFVRSRCVKYGYDFPLYKEVFVTDTQAILKAKFCLSSNRLATACRHFGIAAKTHPLDADTWQAAGIGGQKALKFIWAHNIEDVDSTRKLYEKIEPYINPGRRSI